MSDKTIEQEIQAKGLTAPRVTPDDIEAAIVHTEIVKHTTVSGKVLRWAVITARNGFAVTGRPSAAVSVENDNEEVGRKVAIENAREELWPLLGYELSSKLAAVPLHEPAQTGKYARKDIKMMRTVYNPARRTELIQAELRDGTYVEVDLYYLPHRALQTEVEIVEAVLEKANGVRQ